MTCRPVQSGTLAVVVGNRKDNASEKVRANAWPHSHTTHGPIATKKQRADPSLTSDAAFNAAFKAPKRRLNDEQKKTGAVHHSPL
jgi:hypothetical protein